MKARSMLWVIVAAMAVVLALCAAPVAADIVVLYDDFSAGKNPAWVDVDPGVEAFPGPPNTLVANGFLYSPQSAGAAVRNDLSVQDATVQISSVTQGGNNNPAIFLRYQDNLHLVWAQVSAGQNALYFHIWTGVEHAWGQYGTTSLAGLDFTQPMYMTAWAIGDQAQAIVTQGANIWQTPLVTVPVTTGYTGTGGWSFMQDDFKVSIPGTPSTGNLSLTITDSITHQTVSGAEVTLTWPGGSQSATTGPDGKCYFMNLETGGYSVAATRLGYYALVSGVQVQPGENDETLEMNRIGIDWGVVATASASSGDASRVNDKNTADPPTAWVTDFGNIWPGDSVMLSWPESVAISAVLIDLRGPHPDYTVQTSLDGFVWTDQKRVQSSPARFYDHWLELVEFSAPVTVKHVQLMFNADGGPANKVYGLECYKARGTVTGYVKDTTGAAVANATVVVNDDCWSTGLNRGGSVLPTKVTTGSDGKYTILIPEGAIIVTAAAPDGMTTSSSPLVVTAGLTTNVSDLVVARGGGQMAFRDEFTHPDGPDPDWDVVSGSWSVVNNAYQITPEVPSKNIALVKGIVDKDVAGDVDVENVQAGVPIGIAGRLTDQNNHVVARLLPWGGFAIEEVVSGIVVGEHHVSPHLPEGPGHIRLVVSGDQAQGIIYNDNAMYFTDRVRLTTLFGYGRAGLYCESTGGVLTEDFDNFELHGGGVAPPPVSVGEAKNAGIGWSGDVKGIVTAVFTDYNEFVIEAEDRSAALAVTPLAPSDLVIGEEVIVSGAILSNGKLGSPGAVRTGRAGVIIDPVGVNNRDIIGPVPKINANLGFSAFGGGQQVWLKGGGFTSSSGHFVPHLGAPAHTLTGSAYYFYSPTLSGPDDQLPWWAEYEIHQADAPFPLTGDWKFWARASQPENANAYDSDWLIVRGDPNDTAYPDLGTPTNDNNRVLNEVGSTGGFAAHRFGWFSSMPASDLATKRFNVIDGKISFRLYEREASTNNAMIDAICWSKGAYVPNDLEFARAMGTGLDNQAMLVTTWGRVQHGSVMTADGATRFHITDGYTSGAPTVTMPAIGSILFQDNFDDGEMSGWSGQAPAVWGTPIVGVTNSKLNTGSTTLVIVDGSNETDCVVSLDAVATTMPGVTLRFKTPYNFIMGFYSPIQQAIWFHEYVNDDWSQYGRAGAPGLGPNVHITGSAVGGTVTLTVTDGVKTYWTTHTLAHEESLVGGSYGVCGGGNAGGDRMDNVLVAVPGPNLDISGDTVQVVVPPSVTGAPEMLGGEYVRVTGIAAKGYTSSGNIRAVIVRDADEVGVEQ